MDGGEAREELLQWLARGAISKAQEVFEQSAISLDDELREAAVHAALRSFRRHFHWVLPSFIECFGLQSEPRLQALAREHVRIALDNGDPLTAKSVADTFHLPLPVGAEEDVETAKRRIIDQLKNATTIVFDGTQPATNRPRVHDSRPLRFYVASTFADMKTYRLIAAERIRAVGHEIELAESFERLSPQDVAAACRSLLRSCDACVLVLGSRRGSGPDDRPDERLSTPSFTMLEFREALDADLPVLAYFLDEQALGRQIPAERDTSQDSFMDHFRTEVMAKANVRHISLDAQFDFRLGFDVVDLAESLGDALLANKARRTWTNDTLLNVLGPMGPGVVATALPHADEAETGRTLALLNGYPDDTSGDVFRRADHHNDFGWGHHERGEFAKALLEYDQALAACRGFPLVWNNKGLAYFRLGEFRLAEDAYMEAIRLRPEFVAPWSNMGILHWELKRDAPTARRWLNRALGLDPNYHRALEYIRALSALDQ